MISRRLVALIVLAISILRPPAPAAAHPLGNFTINHLAKIRIERDRVYVHYVLDLAEIPTFAIMHASGNQMGAGTRELQAWAQSERATVMAGLGIDAGGTPLTLIPRPAQVTTRPGAGGLPTLYWTDDLSATLPSATNGTSILQIVDRTYENRIGWKDIVVGSQSEPTRELRHYPSALLGSPRDVRALAVTISAQGVVLNVADSSSTESATIAGASQIRSNTLSDMLSRGTSSPLWVTITLLVAIGLGALHALEPGHGKTLLAVSLVGARATTKQAVLLAGALTLAHTAGVLALGVALVFAAKWVVPERVYPWITLLSGVVVAFMGGTALARLIRQRRGERHAHHDHEHARAAHAHRAGQEHGHGYAHARGHGHSHAHDGFATGDRPLTFRNVVLIAMSGNIAPCPAALVVLLAALTLHEVGYGLAVVTAFGLGLAAVLTGLGIVLVRGADWLAKRPSFDRLAAYAPLASASIIAAIGSVMLAQGAATALGAPQVAIAALTLTAIAAFALSPGHVHAQRSSAPAQDQGAAS
jgi:nickel/cobalt transporter (NicO) family protein